VPFVDVFTTRPLAGNPLSVVPGDCVRSRQPGTRFMERDTTHSAPAAAVLGAGGGTGGSDVRLEFKVRSTAQAWRRTQCFWGTTASL
jgi:hypothetical protein